MNSASRGLPHCREDVGDLLAFFSANVALFIQESDVVVALIFRCVLTILTDQFTESTDTGVMIFYPFRLGLSADRFSR